MGLARHLGALQRLGFSPRDVLRIAEAERPDLFPAPYTEDDDELSPTGDTWHDITGYEDPDPEHRRVQGRV